MTQEDKEIILKDLCARMPYGVICHYNCAIRYDTMVIEKANCVGKLEGIIPLNGHIGFMVGGDKVNALFGDIKPYLRPMESMTKEEQEEYFNSYDWEYFEEGTPFDWLNAHHFDFRNLIERGLGIDCTGLNIYENEKSI